MNPTKLHGVWLKATKSKCADLYPDQLEVRDGGLYFGHKTSKEFTNWDAGTWEVAGPSDVKLSTANDAVIKYNFKISGDVLTFKDAQGCEIEYRRKL